MKESEYLERRKSHWLKYFRDPESECSEDHGPAAQRAIMDARAAEAAGVVWEPEGPPELPAHLIVVKEGPRMGRLAYQAANNAIAELTLEDLDEVKRRCEAWPELSKLAAELPEREDTDPCRWGCLLYEVRNVLRGDPR